MRMPGFSAEASAYQSSLAYRSVSMPALASASEAVVPSAVCWDTDTYYCVNHTYYRTYCCLYPTNGDVTMGCAGTVVGTC